MEQSDINIETNLIVKERTVKWTIRNCSKYGNFVESPFFSISGFSTRCKIFLDYVKKDQSGYHLLDVKMGYSRNNSTVKFPVGANGDITFKKTSGDTISNVRILTFNVSLKESDTVHFGQIKTSSQIPPYIDHYGVTDDIVIIKCKMNLSYCIDSSITPILDQKTIDQTAKQDILKLIYERNTFCDFTFNCGGKVISAHKSILSARSPVFEKMFIHDSLEKQTSSMSVEDVDYEVFGCFVRYIYTWEINESCKKNLNMLLDLYGIGDKYQIADLQRLCSAILHSKFTSINTVCKILEVADLHQDKIFKDQLLEFVLNKFSEVAKTSGWSNLMATNVQLASDIVAYVTSATTSSMN